MNVKAIAYPQPDELVTVTEQDLVEFFRCSFDDKGSKYVLVALKIPENPSLGTPDAKAEKVDDPWCVMLS